MKKHQVPGTVPMKAPTTDKVKAEKVLSGSEERFGERLDKVFQGKKKTAK